MIVCPYPGARVLTGIHTIKTSEELRELERQLKIAYMNKERAAQHREHALLRDVGA